MEHLLLPQDEYTFLRVTYDAEPENYYDEKAGNWFDYPERCGWSKADLMGENEFGGRSEDEVTIFFQSWLYFGFAIEVLKAVGTHVDTWSFVTEGEWPPFVTTAALPEFLVEWHDRWPKAKVNPDCTCGSYEKVTAEWKPCKKKPCWLESNPPLFSDAWKTTSAILDRVQFFLDRYCTNTPKKQVKGQPMFTARRKSWPVSDEISTTMLALGHTLRRAAIDIWNIPRMGDEWTTGSSATIKTKLMSRWCKSDATQLMEDFQIDGQYYLCGGLDPPSSYVEIHSDCTEERCRAKVNEDKYVTKHAPGCDSKECRVNFAKGPSEDMIDSIVDIIQRDMTPVVIWNPKTLELSVTEHNPHHAGEATKKQFEGLGDEGDVNEPEAEWEDVDDEDEDEDEDDEGDSEDDLDQDDDPVKGEEDLDEGAETNLGTPYVAISHV